jgi:hypothetical protein
MRQESLGALSVLALFAEREGRRRNEEEVAEELA